MSNALPAFKRILVALDGGRMPASVDVEVLRALVSSQLSRVRVSKRGRPRVKHLDQRHVEALVDVLGLVNDGTFKTITQAMAWAPGRVALSHGSLKRYIAKPAYRRMAQYMLAEDALPIPDWAAVPVPPKDDFT